jgi:hypothetical protein
MPPHVYVVDQHERCVLRSDQMIGERVAHRGAGHGAAPSSSHGLVRPKLTVIMVSGCHLILMIRRVK